MFGLIVLLFQYVLQYTIHSLHRALKTIYNYDQLPDFKISLSHPLLIMAACHSPSHRVMVYAQLLVAGRP